MCVLYYLISFDLCVGIVIVYLFEPLNQYIIRVSYQREIMLKGKGPAKKPEGSDQSGKSVQFQAPTGNPGNKENKLPDWDS